MKKKPRGFSILLTVLGYFDVFSSLACSSSVVALAGILLNAYPERFWSLKCLNMQKRFHQAINC